MDATPLVRIAALIGEAGRIRMLTLLLDGRSHSASELASAAAASPQTASSHLAKLLDGGLIAVERKGRQHLFRLKNQDVARAVEAIGALVTSGKQDVPEIRFARTCYDHLAGTLAVSLRNAMLAANVLRRRRQAFLLTPQSAPLLRSLDIDPDALAARRRAFACQCLDWTERHHHIGGALGAALLDSFLERNWLVPIRETRALRVTRAGERAFESNFGIHCAALRARHSLLG